MPMKNNKQKRRVVPKESSGKSTVSSGKVKPFKKPGLVLNKEKPSKIVPAATALAGVAVGALLATYGKKKEAPQVIYQDRDADTVREQVNEARSKTFRECKEAESAKINDLNDKNEKNTKIISENQKKISSLEAENRKLQAIVDRAESRYQDLKEKCSRIETNLMIAQGTLGTTKNMIFQRNI